MAYKRLEEHTFTWPAIKDGVMNLGHAQFEALFVVSKTRLRHDAGVVSKTRLRHDAGLATGSGSRGTGPLVGRIAAGHDESSR